MVKLLALAALVSIACKLVSGRWAWELLAGDARKTAETKARNLLGISVSGGHEEVIEAHRRLITQVHPDRGGSSEAVHEANAARDLLLARLADRRNS